MGTIPPLRDKGYTLERKSNAVRKWIDPLNFCKLVVLQPLFNLSSEEVECQVNDRRSFEVFVGLGRYERYCRCNYEACFGEGLRKADVIEEPFEQFEGYLREQGLEARGVKSLLQLWCQFQSNATSEKRARKSRKVVYQVVGIRTHIDCSRRTWTVTGSK